MYTGQGRILPHEDAAFLQSPDSVESVDYRSISFSHSPELSPILLYRQILWDIEDAYTNTF